MKKINPIPVLPGVFFIQRDRLLIITDLRIP